MQLVAHTKLFKHNESATEWQCTARKIILGELILINLCRPALGVRFYETLCNATIAAATTTNTTPTITTTSVTPMTTPTTATNNK